MSPTEPKPKRGRPSKGITEANLRLYAPRALMEAMRAAAKKERISYAEAWRRAAREWLGFTVVLVLLSSCGAPFVPAYAGEPDCGRATALHAEVGAACAGEIQVACDCDDRNTLECSAGTWVWRHFLCYDGLNVSVP